MRRLKFIILITVLSMILIFFMVYKGCSNKYDTLNSETNQFTFENLDETNEPETFQMSYDHLDGTETRTFNVDTGDNIKFKYSSSNKGGILTISITDPYGSSIANLPINKNGNFKICTKGTGKITISVTAKNASGSFKISWSKTIL